MCDTRLLALSAGETPTFSPSESASSLHEIAIVTIGNDCLFQVALITDVFVEANRAYGTEQFRWNVYSLATQASHITLLSGNAALVLVADDEWLPKLKKSEKEALRRLCRVTRTICASGGAVAALAEIGLLDGRVASAPTGMMSALSERFPNVTFTEVAIFRDGRIMTCAGGVKTAEASLILAGNMAGSMLRDIVATRLLLDSLDANQLSRGASVSARYGFRNTGLSAAVVYIHQTIGERVSSGEIARKTGLSSRQLERLFRQYLQLTPCQFLMKSRLARSRELLMHSNMQLIEVAQAVGFVNVSHFTKCFRQHMGVSPSQLRVRRHQRPITSQTAIRSALESGTQAPSIQIGKTTTTWTQNRATSAAWNRFYEENAR